MPIARRLFTALAVAALGIATSVAEAEGLPCIIFTTPEQLTRDLVERGILPVEQQA